MTQNVVTYNGDMMQSVVTYDGACCKICWCKRVIIYK